MVCRNSRCGHEFSPRRRDQKYCSTVCGKRETARISAAANPEKAAENKRRWVENNPGKAQRAKLRWRKENPEKQQAAYRKCRWSALLAAAKARNIPLSITRDEYDVLVNNPCWYCGSVIGNTSYGIDRINNNFGYVPSNCRPCCTPCNLAKRAMTEQEFRTWVSRIYTNWIANGSTEQ